MGRLLSSVIDAMATLLRFRENSWKPPGPASPSVAATLAYATVSTAAAAVVGMGGADVSAEMGRIIATVPALLWWCIIFRQ